MKVYASPKAKQVSVRNGRLKGLLAFGDDDLFPQTLIDVCNESETAQRCLAVRKQFIEGNGFAKDEIANMVVHRSGLTMDSLLRQTARNLSKLEVVTLLVGYNGNGQMAHVRPCFAEIVRLEEPDEFGNIAGGAVCPYLGSDYEKNKRTNFTPLPFYNPNPDVVLEQIDRAGGIDSYKGQLLYLPLTEWEPGYYHVPSYYSAGRLPVQAEAQLSLYDFKTIENGFNVAGFLATLQTEAAKDEDYNPLNDANSPESQISKHQGAESGSSVAVFRGTKEEIDAMKWLETNGAGLADRYKSTSDRKERQICRVMNVPLELAMVQQQGGITFASDANLKTASQYMNLQVNPVQRGLTQLFSSMFSHWKQPLAVNDFSIQVLNYFPDGVNAAVAQPK